ncbi:hypothetical protein SDC9_76233 [bioreactor metagenome]|uniref:Uncharacterized protein n=1 Tax=bioreactor metagenome TaxID=1076179 RepID=A0A644YT95_9ZZZZ
MGKFNKGKKVLHGTVYTSIAHKSHEVQGLTTLLYIVECFPYLSVIEEGLAAAIFIDPYKVLIYNSSCSNIKVSHFRITHLAFGKAYILPACFKK